VWFAVAAVIPVAFYYLLFRAGGQWFDAGLPFFPGSPILIGGISGLLLGSSILDPEEVSTEGQAAVRGLLVGLLSYLLLFTVSAVILAFKDKDPVGLVITWTIIFFMGLLFVGWLIAGVGAIAGWLLFQYRVKTVDGQKKG
jgi:hypothetical protein